MPDLKAIFAKHTNNHKSATYAQYLWILYHVARPNSEFLERMDAEKKQMHKCCLLPCVACPWRGGGGPLLTAAQEGCSNEKGFLLDSLPRLKLTLNVIIIN